MSDLEEKFGRRRLLLVCFGVLAVLFIFLTIALNASYRRYDFQGTILRLVSVDHFNGVVEMVDEYGNRLSMTIHQSHNPFAIEIVISYLDKAITRTSLDGFFGSPAYTFSDGSQITIPAWIVTFSDGSTNLPALSQTQQAEMDLMGRLRDYYHDYRSVWLYVWYTAIGLVVLLIGLGEIFYPERFWRIRTYWSVRGGEPTDFAISMHQLSGVILIIAVYIGLIFIRFA